MKDDQCWKVTEYINSSIIFQVLLLYTSTALYLRGESPTLYSLPTLI